MVLYSKCSHVSNFEFVCKFCAVSISSIITTFSACYSMITVLIIDWKETEYLKDVTCMWICFQRFEKEIGMNFSNCDSPPGTGSYSKWQTCI